ncbi:MAG: cytochrome c3 family protein [Pseudomonadota bacterium]
MMRSAKMGTLLGALALLAFAAAGDRPSPGAALAQGQAKVPSRDAGVALAPFAMPANIAPALPPAQPIPFSHAQHAGALALPCAGCHTGADQENANGGRMTFPATALCMGCHESIARERPAIQRLARYHAAGEPVPWARVYEVLPGVAWRHRPHLEAGVSCATCHGDVARLAVMAEVTAVTAMATCLACHKARNANTQCVTCHAWPDDNLLADARD